MYRVGLPLWKSVARMGIPVLVRVHVYQDPETRTFWAKSPDLDGLIVSGETLDEVRDEVLSASNTLLELAVDGHAANAKTELRIRDSAYCAA
jgi:predicted RNase H-like HicB family nuclease